MAALAGFPSNATSYRGSVGPKVSTSTRAPAIPSITPAKTEVGLPKTTIAKSLGVKAVKVTSVPPINHDAIRAAVGTMPSPTASAYGQAQGLVASDLNPLISQLISGYTQQGRAGGQAIDQVTAEYAKQLGLIAPQVQQDYGAAEQGTAATNAALSQEVSGGGTADANALAARLASIGEPGATNPVVAQLGTQAQGAGGALLGTGSATLDALIGSGAAQQGAALRLPATAREAGLQELAQYLGSLSTAESKDVGTLTAKAPSLEQSAANSLLGSQEKAAALAGQNQRSTASIDAANARSATTAKTARTKTLIATILTTNIDPKTGLLTPQGVSALRKLGVTTNGGVAGSVGAGIVKGNLTAAGKQATLAQGQEKINATASKNAVAENQGWARIAIAQTNSQTSAGRLALAKATAAAKKGTGTALTADETAKLVAGWHNGTIKSVRIPAINPATHQQAVNTNGVPQYATVSKPVGQIGYIQAIQGLVGLGKPLPAAVAAVNGMYGDQMQAAINEFATTAANQGMTQEAALALGDAQGVFPPQALEAAVTQAYAQIPRVPAQQPGQPVVGG